MPKNQDPNQHYCGKLDVHRNAGERNMIRTLSIALELEDICVHVMP